MDGCIDDGCIDDGCVDGGCIDDGCVDGGWMDAWQNMDQLSAQTVAVVPHGSLSISTVPMKGGVDGG